MPRSSWQIALSNPINLLMLVVSIGAGLICAWWLFPLGVLLWAIMVLTMVLDPSIRIKQTIEDRPRLPERFEGLVSRLEKSQVVFLQSMESSRFQIKGTFGEFQTAINNLVDQSRDLCVQLTPLESYIQANVTSNPQKDLDQLDRLISIIEDPAAKKGYDSARQDLLLKASKFNQAKETLKESDVLLNQIVAEMENSVNDSVRLKKLKVQEIQPQISLLVKRVNQQISQIEDFENQKIKNISIETRIQK
jgi:hypothetical protein